MVQTEPIIRVENVHKAFNSHPVLCGINLDISPHETTVVIGPSGCGKSVLLRHVVGLLKPDQGKVFFRKYEVSAMSERMLARVRSRIGFLFQGGALFDSMTVEQNVCFPLDEHSVGTRSERKDKCRTVLSLVGLDGIQEQYPEELSGGQKKRVALARAIALGPEVILYDEPTTGLDPIRADLINELIIKLQRALGTTAIVVTHDMASARKVGDRIVMLDKGHFIVDTTPEELDDIDDETVMRFINGQASEAELAELQTEQFAATGGERDG
ncbi:MAG: ATP-binding cassette domain-containing protein [Phycisphaerae bacterium]|jgi:phospholipid/cholesterol/gamma-HCH transport system ATP-binding protein|nr:ATP-binding cassette domain-containing protein [Phycisphaerae bacterium]